MASNVSKDTISIEATQQEVVDKPKDIQTVSNDRQKQGLLKGEQSSTKQRENSHQANARPSHVDRGNSTADASSKVGSIPGDSKSSKRFTSTVEPSSAASSNMKPDDKGAEGWGDIYESGSEDDDFESDNEDDDRYDDAARPGQSATQHGWL
ncbi:hypothetical protein Slin15195_G032300 [Septoria linicola]|uniref:Uncharacterized protein n=1 Tax=Septoria linicola TaxID=215465 RepID=A0A9Q9APX2_9PEZI|nr:hypothetical protein Slin14017_G031320 [Septoria linicola]USW49911.1 hypothetical protein Slin15195_G032300 [Septoria linicola]